MDGAAKNSTLIITRSTESSLPAVNSLIGRSKSYWPWPIEYLKQASVLHRISDDYLKRNDSFDILDCHNELVGFFSVAVGDTKLTLDNLWVTPDRIGRGIGRQACEYAFQLAKVRGHTELWVVPDPPAEGFYLRLGFRDTGERAQSRVPNGPLFSIYCRQVL